MNTLDLEIKDPEKKQRYFDILAKDVRIPVCKNCGKLFSLGFPNNEDGLADYLISSENNLICCCEYFIIISKLHNDTKSDGLIDVNKYYKVI